MTLYNDLDIDSTATLDDIKKAYRQKARKAHPDHGGDKEEFNKVSTAYIILSDPEKRDRYDRTGETDTPEDPLDLRFRSLLREAFPELRPPNQLRKKETQQDP